MLTESYIRELIKQCYGISGSASKCNWIHLIILYCLDYRI